MAVTLAQASLNAASDIDRNVIDEFRKSSFLLDNIQFDQAVNPAGGGERGADVVEPRHGAHRG